MHKQRFHQLVTKSQNHHVKSAQHKARAQLADALLTTTLRKQETSRKIEIGSLALNHMRENPDSELASTLIRLLNRYVRPHRRHLFEEFGITSHIPKGSPAQITLLKQKKRQAQKKLAANDTLSQSFKATTAR